jgi:hypothetical protein
VGEDGGGGEREDVVYGGRRRAATKSRYVANFLARSGIGVAVGRPPDSLLARSCNASAKSAAPSARERRRVRVRAMSVSTADADRTVYGGQILRAQDEGSTADMDLYAVWLVCGYSRLV